MTHFCITMPYAVDGALLEQIRSYNRIMTQTRFPTMQDTLKSTVALPVQSQDLNPTEPLQKQLEQMVSKKRQSRQSTSWETL